MSNEVREMDTDIGFKEASRDPQLFEKTFTAAPKKGEQFVPFNSAAGENVMSMGDSYIVMTKDRPKGTTRSHQAHPEVPEVPQGARHLRCEAQAFGHGR